MKLEDHVINLEWAKELSKRGVKRESLFWWIEQKILLCTECKRRFYYDEIWGRPKINHCDQCGSELSEGFGFAYVSEETYGESCVYCPAYISSELGEMIPVWKNEILGVWRYEGSLDGKNYHCGQVLKEHPFEIPDSSGTSEANARAAMLVFLIDKELVEVEKINKEDL